MDFKRTGSADFPDHLKVMVSGPPKSGKTTLLGTVPNIVVADTEPFANNLQSIAHKNVPYVTITGTEDLKSLLIVLRDDAMRAKAAEQLGMPKIEAVAIDTLDTLQQIMKAERLRETRQSQFLRDDWGWIKEEMTSILRAFTALPLHVFFIVHTKTQEIGRGDDSRTTVLPGLQGSIAEDIAGMVGYSLLAFRKQEIRPDGSPYTKYWLRAEGDETYAFLGNRAAGRLPDIIEPSFQAIFDAAQASRDEAAAAGNSSTVPLSTVVMTAQPPVTKSAKAEEKKPDDAPVNAAALTHTKKVYEAIGFEFPAEIIQGLTIGQARDIVRYWQAAQADEAEGKADAAQEMKNYLVAMGYVVPDDRLNLNSPTLDISASIDTILAYVEDSATRAQEAYDAESAKASPRTTLLSTLVGIGAKPPIAPEAVEALAVEDEVVVEATPEEAPTTEATMTEAIATAQESLGASFLDESQAPCEECGGPIDDPDIATISRTRFKRWLCVSDYVKQTKTVSA